MVLEIFLDSGLLSIKDQKFLFVQLGSHRYVLKGLAYSKLSSYKV